MYFVKVHWCNTTGLILWCSFHALEADTMFKAEQTHLLIMPILLLKTEWAKAVNKQWFIGELSTEMNLLNNL